MTSKVIPSSKFHFKIKQILQFISQVTAHMCIYPKFYHSKHIHTLCAEHSGILERSTIFIWEGN